MIYLFSVFGGIFAKQSCKLFNSWINACDREPFYGIFKPSVGTYSRSRPYAVFEIPSYKLRVQQS